MIRKRFSGSDLPARAKRSRIAIEQFLKVWPEARQRIPHLLMQEMRITPELPAYADIIHKVFLELIDGRLVTPEEARAFLEPHSPPAPPPQVTIKRTRAKRGAEAKVKERSFDDEDEAGDALEEEDLDDIGGEDEEIDIAMVIPKRDLELEAGDEGESDEEDADDDEADGPPVKPSKKQTAAQKKAAAAAEAKAEKAAAAKPAKAGKPEPPTKSKVVAPVAKAKPATYSRAKESSSCQNGQCRKAGSENSRESACESSCQKGGEARCKARSQSACEACAGKEEALCPREARQGVKACCQKARTQAREKAVGERYPARSSSWA